MRSLFCLFVVLCLSLFALAEDDACNSQSPPARITLRKSTDGNRYFVVFASRECREDSTTHKMTSKWTFGHAFVDWCVEDGASRQSSCQAYGLYAKDESPAGVAHSFIGPVPAVVRDEACDFDGENEECRHSATMISNDLIVEVDKSMYGANLARAQQLMAMVENGDISYQLGASDCDSFVATVSSGLGLNIPLQDLGKGDVLPSTFISDLIKSATTPTTISTPAFSFTGMTYLGIPEGSGVLTLPDGTKLNGLFEGGYAVHGTIAFSNGDSYVGDLKEWEEDGNGTYKFKKGDTIDGTFAAGKIAAGTVTLVSGGSLKGTWTNGQLTQATIHLKDGNSYTGGIDKRLLAGPGTIQFKNGDRFDGTFAAGNAQGPGTYTTSNGQRITGNWDKGKLVHTNAHVYSPTGQEIPFPDVSDDPEGTGPDPSGTIDIGGGDDDLMQLPSTSLMMAGRLPKQALPPAPLGSGDRKVGAVAALSTAIPTNGSDAAQSGTYTDLHDFNSDIGDPLKFSYGRLAQGRDGNFYGESELGGTSKSGTIFKLTAGGTATIIHNLVSADGQFPKGGLTLGTDGNFYGDTTGDTVFKVTPSGTLTVLHTFHNSDMNSLPEGALILSTNGSFYGATYANPAIIYQVTSSGAFSVIQTLSESVGYEGTQLSLGRDGNLYGGTFEGGPNGAGTAFVVTPAGTLTVLHNFAGIDGRFADFGLVQAASGTFYGAAQTGGTKNAGTIYSLTSSGNFTLLHSLNGTTDGSGPRGQLLLASDGNMYGVTFFGGTKKCGTIFKVTPDGTYSVVHNFECSLGGIPQEQLIQGTNGVLYGLADQGGAHHGGAFYSLDLHLPAFLVLLPAAGGLGGRVGILGQGFSNSSVVKFGGAQATSVTVDGSTFISAAVPTGAHTGNVTVTTGAVTLSSTQAFEVR